MVSMQVCSVDTFLVFFSLFVFFFWFRETFVCFFFLGVIFFLIPPRSLSKQKHVFFGKRVCIKYLFFTMPILRHNIFSNCKRK